MKRTGFFLILLTCTFAASSFAESPGATPFPWRIQSKYDTASTAEEIAACESGSYLIGSDIHPGVYTIIPNEGCSDSFSIAFPEGKTETVDLSEADSWSFYATEGETLFLPDTCTLIPLQYAPGFQQVGNTQVTHSRFFTGYEMPTVQYFVYPMEEGVSYYRVTSVQRDVGLSDPEQDICVFPGGEGAILDLEGVNHRDLFVEFYHCIVRRVPAEG